MASLGKITAELEVKFKDFVDGMGKAEDAVEGVGDEMDKVRKGPGAKLDKWFRGAAAIGIAKYGTDLFNLGADVEQWGRNYEITFGSVSGALDTFIDDHNERFGVGEEALKNFAAVAGQVVKGLGFDEGQAATFVEDLLTLAGALSEFMGVDIETAVKALTDGVSGQFDALKSLGVTIDKAQVDALLAEQDMGDLEGAARDQAEAIAILELAYADSKDELALFEEGQGDAQEAANNLTAVWADVKEDLAEVVVALAPLVDAFADLFGWLNTIPGLVPGMVTAMALLALGIGGPLAVALALVAALAAIGQFGSIGALDNILSNASSAASGAGSAIAGLVGGGGGGGGATSTRRASGGPLAAGQAALVGERGPEVFVPRQAGMVVPNGGMGTTINVNVAGSVISEGDLVEAVRRGLRSDTIRGGSLEFA